MDLHKRLNNQEVSALSLGVEAVLRRLIRPLIGSVSLARLQEMLRLVYVEEAEEHLRGEYPDRSVPVGQMALLTGMDTRQLNRMRRKPGGTYGREDDSRYTNQVTPTTHLLDLWSTDPELVDQDSGQPLPLAVFGKERSIEALMKSSTFIRGVTPRSVADRLVLSGSATETADGRLNMVTDKFLPSHSKDMEGAIEVGFHAIERLVDTVVTNLDHLGTATPRLYQRAYWTNRLAPHRRDEFQQRLHELLADCEDQGTTALAEMEMRIESPSQLTAGFGLYYFEDSTGSSSGTPSSNR